MTALPEYAPTETDLSYERKWAADDFDRCQLTLSMGRQILGRLERNLDYCADLGLVDILIRDRSA
jgi:hypothetical protein